MAICSLKLNGNPEWWMEPDILRLFLLLDINFYYYKFKKNVFFSLTSNAPPKQIVYGDKFST